MAYRIRWMFPVIKMNCLLQKHVTHGNIATVLPKMRFSESSSSISEASKRKGKVRISEQCAQRLKNVAGDSMLRVSVDGGGCSGFQYKFDLDTTVNEDDCVFDHDGAKVVIDEISLEYLDGATVDYNEELIRSAFRIVSNPKAEQGCSCGASFAVKV